LKLPLVPLEDVLTTGFAAQALSIPRVDVPQFLNEVFNPYPSLPPCELIHILTGMTDGSPYQMYSLWYKFLLGRSVYKCQNASISFTESASLLSRYKIKKPNLGDEPEIINSSSKSIKQVPSNKLLASQSLK